jgi:4-amino-4-deoxy-L-arabinose transferase-like glycosyltransferase
MKNAFVFWTAIGLGILIKGPIILLPLFATLLWLRCAEKNLGWFRHLKPVAGIIYALALIAPWFIAINLASHGRFTQQAGGHDFLAKIWQAQDRGFLPPGFYAAIFPAMFFPFSLFALLAIPDAWAIRRERSVRFCIGWIIPTWIVFEAASTKLPNYILPAYPAIALLTAKIFFDGFPVLAAMAKRWFPIAVISLWVMVGTGFAIGLAILPVIVDHTINPAQIAGSFILLVAQGAGLLFFLQRKRIASIAALTLGMLIFSTIAFSTTLPDLKRLWVARAIVHEARRVMPCHELRLVSAGYQEPSLAFLAGTATKLVPNGTYAAAEMQNDLCRVGVIDKHVLGDFLNDSRDNPTQPVAVGTTVEGINTGHGSGTELYFYVMPQTREPRPVYR